MQNIFWIACTSLITMIFSTILVTFGRNICIQLSFNKYSFYLVVDCTYLFLTIAYCFNSLFQLYLSQYGYLGISPSKVANSSNLIDGRVLNSAVAEFQSFAGLDVTGKQIFRYLYYIYVCKLYVKCSLKTTLL